MPGSWLKASSMAASETPSSLARVMNALRSSSWSCSSLDNINKGASAMNASSSPSAVALPCKRLSQAGMPE
eukprot:87032-Prorocentrum_minimum.AAC.1